MKQAMKRMLEEIEAEARLTGGMTGRPRFAAEVMDAMARVPREKFVPDDSQRFAYANGPLSIGYGQTISQPYIVALMTDLLDLKADSRVLEIGTGSGYQAAILALLAADVYSVETIPELCQEATERLQRLGYKNVHTRCDDGHAGWSEKAPFDAIIVTAAATHIPPKLTEQLKPGGRMIIPIGLPYMHQELILLVKDEQGHSRTESLLDVAFVPLVMRKDKTTEDAS